MGIVRRLLSIGTGLAAGVLAYKLLDKYNQDVHLEGDYRVVPPEEEAEEEPAQPEQPAAPEEEEVPAPAVEEEKAPAPEKAPAQEPPVQARPQPPVSHEAPEAPGVDRPNVNPLMREAPESVVGPDGKIDPTKVAEAADFGDWEDLGCRG